MVVSRNSVRPISGPLAGILRRQPWGSRHRPEAAQRLALGQRCGILKEEIAPLVVPAEGYVYTVRAVLDARPYGFDCDALLLEEVVNPVMAHTTAPVAGAVFEVEVFFLAWRFRPLHDANIEVFTRMLEPVPQEPAELVDA